MKSVLHFMSIFCILLLISGCTDIIPKSEKINDVDNSLKETTDTSDNLVTETNDESPSKDESNNENPSVIETKQPEIKEYDGTQKNTVIVNPVRHTETKPSIVESNIQQIDDACHNPDVPGPETIRPFWRVLTHVVKP